MKCVVFLTMCPIGQGQQFEWSEFLSEDFTGNMEQSDQGGSGQE